MADKSEHRELLRLAADAAGIPTEWSAECECPLRLDRVGAVPWSPLEDDGDALRLAVALRITVQFPWDDHRRTLKETHCWTEDDYPVEESHGTDPAAATRRAIVRAAAAIGATKEGGNG